MEMLTGHKTSDGGLLERIDQKLPSHYPNAIAFLEELLSATKYLEAEIGDRPPVEDIGTTAQRALIRSLAEVCSKFFGNSPSDGWFGSTTTIVVRFLRSCLRPMSLLETQREPVQ